jgi:hypothetical protein
VYAVWVDQVWYWQNVRPRLRDQKQAWGFLMQGILGTMVVSLVLAVMMGKVLAAAGEEIDWYLLIFGVIVVTALASVLLTAVTWIISRSMNKILPYSMMFGIVISLLVVGNVSCSTVVGKMIIVLLSCVIFGFAFGVSDVLTSGVIESVTAIKFGVWVGMFVGIASGRVRIDRALAAIATISSGYYLGGRWAMRQIPNAETRKRLAGSDTSPPKS